MPQARNAGSESGSRAKATPSRRKPKSTADSSAGGARAAGASASAASGSGSTSSARSTSSPRATKAKPSASSPEVRLDAAAVRLRKLNERIIEAGKQTGESTLSSYEKALKAIASAVERGPGSSDIDWISHLATTQAKFIRDFTEAWTSAARGMLK